MLIGSKEFQASITVQSKFPGTTRSTEQQIFWRHQAPWRPAKQFSSSSYSYPLPKRRICCSSRNAGWAQWPGPVLSAKDRKVNVIPSTRGERHVIRWKMTTQCGNDYGGGRKKIQGIHFTDEGKQGSKKGNNSHQMTLCDIEQIILHPWASVHLW